MNAKFDELREKYPVFTYEGYDYGVENGNLNIVLENPDDQLAASL